MRVSGWEGLSDQVRDTEYEDGLRSAGEICLINVRRWVSWDECVGDWMNEFTIGKPKRSYLYTAKCTVANDIYIPRITK